ncbi:MAG: ABC transporter ATP-binding protein [Candidatus Omnitrophica bacterium]|nr:ABC transporter ATP-binding protein [Candidatus Omnitrophota bacterium]
MTSPNNGVAVSVQNLEKKFGQFTAVNRINFDVKGGEIFGFLGPNGAGKSTTIRMLCGILMPTSGSGKVGGFDIIKEQAQIKQHIGYMSQKFSLYDDLTVEENINFYSGIYKLSKKEKEERKEKIIKLADLEAFKTRLTKTLSGGWKQRLALGCAIIHQPSIIFLDEPTSGVDPITRGNFWDIIKGMAAKGITIFVTTHYMDEAENCDRMCLIYKGNIIAMGTPNQMKTEHMKNDILEITMPHAENWIDKISALEVVKETSLFGAALHAVVETEKAAVPAIKAMFKKDGLKDYTIRKIMPSLEDVFVSSIENYDRTVGNESKKN